MRMQSTLRNLLIVSVLAAIQNGIGAGVSINENRPSHVFGRKTRMDASSDFLKGLGTAFSFPLSAIIAHALWTILATQKGWLRTVGVVGLTLNGLLGTVGGLGEPVTYNAFRPFRPAKAALVTSHVVLSGLLAYYGIRELVRRRSTMEGMVEEVIEVIE